MDLIKRAWRGEEKLWKVFWIYGVLLGIAISVFFSVVEEFVNIKLFEALFHIVYFIWWFVSAWRCAFNSRKKLWGYLVRAYVALSLILVPIGLLVGGVLVGNDLIKAAECRALIKRATDAGMETEKYIMDDTKYTHTSEEKQKCITYYQKKSANK